MPHVLSLGCADSILRYLKGAARQGLLYRNHRHHIEGYVDAADRAGLLDDRISTVGLLICWR